MTVRSHPRRIRASKQLEGLFTTDTWEEKISVIESIWKQSNDKRTMMHRGQEEKK